MAVNPVSGAFFSREFQKKYFCFQAERPNLIGSFQFERFQEVYIVTRTILIMFYIYIFYLSTFFYETKLPYLLNFMSYSNVLNLASALIQCVCAIHRLQLGGRQLEHTPVLYQVTWMIFTLRMNVAGISAHFLLFDVCYAEFGFPGSTPIVLLAVNNVIILVDFLFSGIPVRMLHFYLGVIFSTIVVIYHPIYWSSGGVDPCNIFQSYQDGLKFAFLLAIAVADSILSHQVIFVFYWLRLIICQNLCCCRNDIKESTAKSSSIRVKSESFKSEESSSMGVKTESILVESEDKVLSNETVASYVSGEDSGVEDGSHRLPLPARWKIR